MAFKLFPFTIESNKGVLRDFLRVMGYGLRFSRHYQLHPSFDESPTQHDRSNHRHRPGAASQRRLVVSYFSANIHHGGASASSDGAHGRPVERSTRSRYLYRGEIINKHFVCDASCNQTMIN